MLFEAARHEPLTNTSWDADVARAAILEIARDAQTVFTPRGLWPIHPLDVSKERAPIMKPIYYGAAGVIWALDHLSREGVISLQHDYTGVLADLYLQHCADSDALYQSSLPGYLIGDAGILLLQYKLSPSPEVADKLAQSIENNIHHPALGLVWGGAGSMLAALLMFEATGIGLWRDLFLAAFDVLWTRWQFDESLGCYLWLTDLYGAKEKRMSALHGMPGIAFCLMRGKALLDSHRISEIVERTLKTLEATAVRDGSRVNWHLSVGKNGGEGTEVMRVQHCVGAPGIVNCFAELVREPEIDPLLLGAGQLTWDAGPLVKLPSLCHGVPGSGFAFLKLYTRTGDQQWLDRARRFAMHAIEQNCRFVDEYGQRKYSLWTGDLGLAVYLWRCITATSSFPTLDEF